MKEKTKKKIEKIIRPMITTASLGQFKITTIEKIITNYIKFLEFIFKITTILTMFWAFTWFFPTYLNLGTEKAILIVLIVILTHLRFGKTDVIIYEKE